MHQDQESEFEKKKKCYKKLGIFWALSMVVVITLFILAIVLQVEGLYIAAGVVFSLGCIGPSYYICSQRINQMKLNPNSDRR